MADIDVVKKSSHTWVWVIAAIAVIMMLFMLFGRRGNNNGSTTGPSGRMGAPNGASEHVAAALTAPPAAVTRV